jgi:DNA-directed RNA polymerase subunit RPC12/RpoP
MSCKCGQANLGDTCYKIIWNSVNTEIVCQNCFAKVVLKYVPTTDFHLNKGYFDVRDFIPLPTKTKAYRKRFRDRKKTG